MATQKTNKQRWFVFAVLIVCLGVLGWTLAQTHSAEASDCWIDSFAVSPSSSPQPVGTTLSLYGRGSCNGGIRASRFNIDGGGFGEDAGAPEQSETWAITEGDHTICFEIAGGSNGDWSAGASNCMSITGINSDNPDTGNSNVVVDTSSENTTSGNVAAPVSCSIEFFNTSPSSPVVVGTEVFLHGRGNCGTSSFEINGGRRAEIGAPEQTEIWRTGEFGVGSYDVCFALRGEGGWESAARVCYNYQVTDASAPPTAPSANIPVLAPQTAQCQVNSFNVSPSGGELGTVFTFAGDGNCEGGARATRFLVDGIAFNEFGGSSNNATWNSGGYAEGNHTISFQVAANGTTDWSQAATSNVDILLGSLIPATEPVGSTQTTMNPNGEGFVDSHIALPGTNEVVDDRLWHGYSSPPSENYLHVVSWGVNIRPEPNLANVPLGAVVSSEYYPVLDWAGDWVLISTSRGKGWVNENFANIYTSQSRITLYPALNGGVCNNSSIPLLVLISNRKRLHSSVEIAEEFIFGEVEDFHEQAIIPPNSCIDSYNIDVDAILGMKCEGGQCSLIAWKVGANRVTVINGNPSGNLPQVRIARFGFFVGEHGESGQFEDDKSNVGSVEYQLVE